MDQEPKKKIISYRDLVVWQKAMDLVVASYRVTKHLPSKEGYGLVSQIRRAAVSIPANIAEGHGRRHLGDYLHCLSVANGSLRELETHLLLTHRLSYLEMAEVEPLLKLAAEVGRMITVLAQNLRKRKLSGALPPAT